MPTFQATTLIAMATSVGSRMVLITDTAGLRVTTTQVTLYHHHHVLF